MKYKLKNSDHLPNIGDKIVILSKNGNMIGIVETIMGDDVVVLLLDKNGRIVINKKNDEWFPANADSLENLRINYKKYIGGNIVELVSDRYKKIFEKKIEK